MSNSVTSKSIYIGTVYTDMYGYFIEGILYDTNFFIPLGNHVPSGNGQFPKPGLYLSHCPPTKTQKFNPYFPKLAKATKTQDGEQV